MNFLFIIFLTALYLFIPIFLLIALYFTVKYAVKNGIKAAYRDITGKRTAEDIKRENYYKEQELEK